MDPLDPEGTQDREPRSRLCTALWVPQVPQSSCPSRPAAPPPFQGQGHQTGVLVGGPCSWLVPQPEGRDCVLLTSMVSEPSPGAGTSWQMLRKYFSSRWMVVRIRTRKPRVEDSAETVSSPSGQSLCPHRRIRSCHRADGKGRQSFRPTNHQQVR